ncbi:50S ribosomal protein L25 [Candidatus Kaiserbacteria bacterium]|nr:50S ribosomal protein L25 [Candidatus Kaiserbacteria bacterium]
MIVTLEVQTRDPKESGDTLRSRGVTPAVFYGPKERATPIAIDARKLEATWKEAGETTIIKLAGVGEEKDSLIHDVQIHPVTGKVLHADFYVIEKGKKVEIAVPLEFVGSAPAEKAGHIIVKALHEVEIEVAPAELPHKLEVDISKLENVGDHITVAEIKLPPSAELKTNSEEIVVSVTEFKEEKIEEPAPAAEGELAEGAVPAEGAEGAPAAAPTGGEQKEAKKE